MLSDENKTLEVKNQVDEEKEILLASVGSMVWNDFDKDGLKGGNDKGVQGIKITLYNAKDNSETDYTDVTDKNGEYLIGNVYPGEYYAVFNPGEDYEFITEGGLVDPIGRSRSFILEEGEINLSINAPIIKNTGSIKGNVFKDITNNCNGDKIAYQGKEIILIDENGGRKKKVTNELGRFTFDGLLDGKYTIVFKEDEDFKCITSKAIEVKVEHGQTYSHINAIYESINKNYFIEGRVFLERVSTGSLKLKDTLVNGIIVQVYKDNKLINSSLTETINGVMGIYRFKNLNNGLYEIRFIIPEGVSFGKYKNAPYGSKVDEKTGVASVLLENSNVIDINASIIIG